MLLIVATKGNLELIASIFNFGTLMTFFFINLSMLQLRKKMPDVNRTFSVPLSPLLPILGMISCFALIFYLRENAIIAAGVWISIGVVVYVFNKQRNT